MLRNFLLGITLLFLGVTSLGLFYETYVYPLDLLELLFFIGSWNILTGIVVMFYKE